jgi:membrane-associated phospholipid phosphatase
MIKLLLILLWPAGIGIILAMAALLTRRDAATAPGRRRQSPGPLGLTARHAGAGSREPRAVAALVVMAAGLAVAYGVMLAVGLAAVHGGPSIDQPVFRFLTAHHREHLWKSLMGEATQFGYKWTTWGAAAAAGTCLAFLWKEHRWVPPVALGSLIVIDHFFIRAVTDTFHRVPPPGSGGTFPSGGCDRVVVFYGLIAYLLWRAVSGRRGPAIWSAAVVAALGFNESYSRTYLGLHWLTDTLSGLLCGGLELCVFILAVRALLGPATAVGATVGLDAGAGGRETAQAASPAAPSRLARPASGGGAG